MTPDTERLRELLGKATPGPWRVGETAIHGRKYGGRWVEVADGETRKSLIPISGTGGSVSYTSEVVNVQLHDDNDANAALIAESRNALPALLDALTAAEDEKHGALNQLDSERHSVSVLEKRVAEKMDALAASEAKVAELEAKNALLVEALRLIELFGYREGEDFGWINAHMRGTATAALEGKDLAAYWRLFPNHRPAALEAKP
jgi:hypothetical protein